MYYCERIDVFLKAFYCCVVKGFTKLKSGFTIQKTLSINTYICINVHVVLLKKKYFVLLREKDKEKQRE